jgi:hypothetical protein
MNNLYSSTKCSLKSFLESSLLGLFVLLAIGGCKQTTHTSDPRLRQMDEMLEAQLPAGTPKTRVEFYLSSQGFPVQNTNDAHVIVAIVHHVDTDTLRPATAQVTFQFDKSDNLKSYELAPAPDSLQQP